MNIVVVVIDYGLVTNIISVLQNLHVPFFIVEHIISLNIIINLIQGLV